MNKTNKNKTVIRLNSRCLRYLFLNFAFLYLPYLLNAQIIDNVFVGETVTYKVQNQQDASYLYWEVTSGEIISENPSLTDSIVIRWSDAGIYKLTVYEETANSCVGELASIEIEIIETDFELELDIPNVFTPNQDGKNDYFTIKANYPPENFSIRIVNRWGNKVFETHDIDNSWDGRRRSEYCSPGVYYYIIQYQNNGSIETKNGHIQLFR